MISWLKKYFIPHKVNDHRPHFLRKKIVALLIVGLVLGELTLYILPTTSLKNGDSNLIGAVLPGVLDSLTNLNRKSFDLKNLKESPLLNKAAQLKAEDMATKGYFAHNSPEGKTSWYWFEQVGYKYDYAGENLAVNFVDSEDIDSAWMNSPTHRDNLLKSTYTEIGTGLATGIYKGEPTIFVVQLYGTPKKTELKPLTTTSSQKQPTNKASISKIATSSHATSVPRVLGASDTEISPSLMEKIIASPHQSSNKLLYFAFSIVSLSLILKVFLKRKHYHQDLLTNGLVVLALIFTLYLLNGHLSTKNSTIGANINGLPSAFIDTKSNIS